MELKKVNSDQLSFSFWPGYILFDFYQIIYSIHENKKELETIFNFLKQKGFGKNLDEDYTIINNEKIYGIFNLEKIHFNNFSTCPKDKFLEHISEYISENYKARKLNEGDLPALLDIVQNKLNKQTEMYDVFMFNPNPLPLMSIKFRYDFFKSYFLFSRDFSNYLHIEIACD